MIKIYQTIIDAGKGNCQQAAIASLLELPLEEVPNFKEFGEHFWNECVNFVISKGYNFDGFLYNNKIQSIENYSYRFEPELNKYTFLDDRFPEIENMKGVKGYFCAGVYSPKYFKHSEYKQITHAVIIDKDFNVVNPINKEYEGITKFPLHWLIGYNGIIDIMMINEK